MWFVTRLAYVCRALEVKRFRPYDLMVVPRTKAGPEYFTISATGVMRVRKGIQVRYLHMRLTHRVSRS